MQGGFYWGGGPCMIRKPLIKYVLCSPQQQGGWYESYGLLQTQRFVMTNKGAYCRVEPLPRIALQASVSKAER